MKLSINDEQPLFGPRGETQSKCVTQSQKVSRQQQSRLKMICVTHIVIKENVKISVNNSLVAKKLQKRFFK